jgi:hypothetical protein
VLLVFECPAKVEAKERKDRQKSSAALSKRSLDRACEKEIKGDRRNASLLGGHRKSKIGVGPDQAAFSARRRTVLRRMIAIEKECIRYSKR